jgi:enamine deaminase RidA (YjgF/YER057c/UK114 family)
MITRIDPAELAAIPGATHVTVGTGTRIVHIAGQTGIDADGAIVGPTHAEQSAQAFSNLRTAIQAAGGTLADTAAITIYIVDYTTDVFDAVVGGALEALGEDFPLTAATLVGVAALWQPGLLIEVTATAVLD